MLFIPKDLSQEDKEVIKDYIENHLLDTDSEDECSKYLDNDEYPDFAV